MTSRHCQPAAANATPVHFGLIGFPLGHSFSAQYFTEKFAREGICAEYSNYEIASAAELTDIVASDPMLRGLNVTIPHKQAVIPLLHSLSPEARAIGAVNVISISHTEKGTFLSGHNTDAIGFRESLRPLLRPDHRRALVLGTGGASNAVIFSLNNLGIETLSVSRTSGAGRITYGEITPELLGEYTIVVNCTPVGMFPHTNEKPDLPYKALTQRHLLFDLVYNPEETRFLQLGREQGAATKNGLEMLHMQAEAAWKIWNG